MILTGPEIQRQVRDRKIVITPFDERLVNPNSYNYRLGPHLLTIGQDGARTAESWDLRTASVVLEPGRLYLGHTAETIGSQHFVTMLNGRSSIGRLGMWLNVSADLGQIGPAHQWTLEIKVVQRLRVHHQMRVGQATFWLPDGEIDSYRGRYTSHSLPTPALQGLRQQP